MRVWVSADSKPPKGWKHAKDAWEAIYFLSEEKVDELALAYDYGGNMEVTGNGITVAAYLHKLVKEDPFYTLPHVEIIETKNSLAVDSINFIISEAQDLQYKSNVA